MVWRVSARGCICGRYHTHAFYIWPGARNCQPNRPHSCYHAASNCFTTIHLASVKIYPEFLRLHARTLYTPIYTFVTNSRTSSPQCEDRPPPIRMAQSHNRNAQIRFKSAPGSSKSAINSGNWKQKPWTTGLRTGVLRAFKPLLRLTDFLESIALLYSRCDM